MRLHGAILISGICAILLGVACDDRGAELSQRDILFRRLEDSLSQHQIDYLKKCRDYTCIRGFMMQNREIGFRNVMNEMLPEYAATVDCFDCDRVTHMVMLRAYSDWARNMDMSCQQMLSELAALYHRDSLEHQRINDAIRSERICRAESNYSNINVGDTLIFKFPIEIRNGDCYAVQRSVCDNDATLNITCTLLNKYRNEKDALTDDMNAVIRILDVSSPSCLFMSKEMVIGLIDTVNIYFYDRDLLSERPAVARGFPSTSSPAVSRVK